MNKIFIAFKAIYKINIKVTIIILIIFSLILSVVFYISKNLDSKDYHIPRTLAYTEVESSELEYLIKKNKDHDLQYSILPPISKDNKKVSIIDFPYENALKIPIEDMEYIDGTGQAILDNQNILNTGEKTKEFPIAYINLPPNAVKDGLNIELEPYDISNIIEGEFPSDKDDILIGETLANYYLMEYGLNSYNDLLGEEIPLKTTDCYDKCIDKMYKVSGIYKTSSKDKYNLSNDEKVFILPNDDYYSSVMESYDRKGIFIYLQSKKEMNDMISKSDYRWYTYKDYMFKNIKYIWSLVIFISLNLLLLILFYKEFRGIHNILSVHKLNVIYYMIIFLSPFLIMNIALIIIFINS